MKGTRKISQIFLLYFHHLAGVRKPSYKAQKYELNTKLLICSWTFL